MCSKVQNIYSTYVPGVKNNIADSLSRLQMTRFQMLAPEADRLPTHCPPLKEVIWTTS